jgi:hypothetical protein
MVRNVSSVRQPFQADLFSRKNGGAMVRNVSFVRQPFQADPFSRKEGGAMVRNVRCAALSGLRRCFSYLTQGVALGWYVAAPSGRKTKWATADGR